MALDQLVWTYFNISANDKVVLVHSTASQNEDKGKVILEPRGRPAGSKHFT